MTVDELVAERSKSHGDWEKQAKLSQALKGCIRVALGNSDFPVQKREALEMICVKMARIVCGDHNNPDHFIDIQGYAELGKSDSI